MTSKSTNKNRTPFLLKPAGKDYLWGGNRLKSDFSKEIDMTPLAETWECSTHPDGPSIVATGEHKGKTLREVLMEHPEYMGENHNRTDGELPILIKFIDAQKDLSVQVHPDDAYAKEHENGSLGKSEMWYVLDASEDASLIYGFNKDIEKEQLRKSLLDGSVERHLKKFCVKKDDMFYIEAGKVHAIGAGILVAEIQENSNLTYRMYDYQRKDANGNLRELHIEKALEVADRTESTSPRQLMRVLKYSQGCAKELLCRCGYFQTERMEIHLETKRELPELNLSAYTFTVLLCIDGCGMLMTQEKEELTCKKGDCIFIPAGEYSLRMQGDLQFLKVSC